MNKITCLESLKSLPALIASDKNPNCVIEYYGPRYFRVDYLEALNHIYIKVKAIYYLRVKIDSFEDRRFDTS